jgi:uncharacterized protein (DUF1800 family)
MPTDRPTVSHLLRRAGFGGTPAEIDAYVPLELPAIVDRLLDTSAVDVNVRPPALANPNLSGWEQRVAMVEFWLDHCATTPTPFIEKMVLFWHGTLVAGQQKIDVMSQLWDMNTLQRRHALGNWRTLLQATALHPAMLLYLDNADNVKGSPNENFARELMELFMIGVGTFAESDVDAAARAWTGHNYDDKAKTYKFYPAEHDNDPKTFMGVTKNWDGPDIINFLLDDPTQRQVAAGFLVRRLWSFFAHPGAPANVVSELSTVFINANYELKPLMRAMFLRPEFYTPAARQGLVRSPVEWFVNIQRQTGLRSVDSKPLWLLPALGQEPFDPPNVSGWRQNRYWLSSAAAAQRAQWASYLGGHLREINRGALVNLTTVPVPQAVQAVFDRLGISEPSARSRTALTNWWTAQRASKDNWFELVGLHQLALQLPELQLA